MADYTLNWTDDSLKSPFVLTGGTLNTASTALALTGKGLVNWGEQVLEDMLKILEKSSGHSAPPHPTAGQLWYDTLAGQLKMRTAASTWVIIWPQF